MCVFVTFYITLCISFSSEDIVTKFAENVYGYENMSGKKFCPYFNKKKIEKAAIADCLKIMNMF